MVRLDDRLAVCLTYSVFLAASVMLILSSAATTSSMPEVSESFLRLFRAGMAGLCLLEITYVAVSF